MDIIKEKTRKQLPPFEEMKERMRFVGCPVTCSKINIKENNELKKADGGTQMMRNRYTFIRSYL